MEVGESERKMPQKQVPWVPATPLRPILPTPAPIWTTGEGSQLGSYSNGVAACFEASAGAEMNHWSHRWSEPAPLAHDNAKIRVPISFADLSGSSNRIAELLTQPDASSAYSSATHDDFFNQLFPTYNSEFNPAYSLLGHHHHHVSREQPFLNTIHDQYQDLQGTPYFAYYNKAFPQIAPPPANDITAEARQDAETQITTEKRNQEGGEKNVSPTPCKSVKEVAALSTPYKEISHDFDLNKTPQPKPRRRKHRPKVIKEIKPKRQQVATKPPKDPSKEKPTEKKARRKGLNTTSTPQTEVTQCTKSAKKTCRRSLNFGKEEQPRNDNSACRENVITHFGRNISAVVEETQALNNLVALQGDSRDWMIAQDYNQILSRESPQLHAVGSKRKQPVIEPLDNNSINLIGAQYNAVQAYSQKYCVQFPNVQKKRRSGKGKISNTPYPSSVTATKDASLATSPQDARSHFYASCPTLWTSASEYNAAGVPVINTVTERAIHDKPQSLEYNLSLGQRRPTKRRSRVPARKCDAKVARTRKQTCSSDRPTFGDAERPQTCIDALVAEMRASLTKKKRTRKRSISVSSAYACTNAMQQHHKVMLESQISLGVAREEIWKNIHTVDALTEQFRHLNIYREATELVPYNQQNQKNKGLVSQNGTMVPYKGPFDPTKKHARPKVDLDEETNRVWRLLLLDINSNGIDGTDEDTIKWWEEERNVFHGRADSFIARMHLVQGDRRFSKWKGSVVDSVVGVFLTQNVSDHLSSSAFMSLAARFPLRSSSKYKTCQEESTSVIVNEPQVCIVEPEENEKLDEKILDQSVCELNSLTIDIIEHSEEREAVDSNDSCRSTNSLIGVTDKSNSKLMESAERHNSEHSPVESGAMSAMTGEGQENLCHESARKELNYVFSSQCSAVTSQMSGDFSIDQNPEKIGSFSDSNSEIEDLSSAAKYNIYHNRTSFSELLEMASSTLLHEVNSQRSKSTENLRDTCGPSIDMKHDNLVENLEKSNVTEDSLEASINEYTLKIAPNSGVVEVNCYDPLDIEAPSSGSSKNKDENDKRSNFPTEPDSQAAIVHSQGKTQGPMQKARELDFGDHNYAIRNENSKKDSAPVG